MVWELSAAIGIISIQKHGLEGFLFKSVPLLTDKVDTVFGTSQLMNQILYIILNT